MDAHPLIHLHTGHVSASATSFAETRDTVVCDLRTAAEQVLMALRMLLVRVERAGLSVVLGGTEATVLTWLARAAQQRCGRQWPDVACAASDPGAAR